MPGSSQGHIETHNQSLTRTHARDQCRVSNSPHKRVVGVWEEAEEPSGGNPADTETTFGIRSHGGASCEAQSWTRGCTLSVLLVGAFPQSCVSEATCDVPASSAERRHHRLWCACVCARHKSVCVQHVVARPAKDLGLNSAASSSLCQLPSRLPCCRQEETRVFLVLSSCGCLATATRPFCRHGNYVSDSGGGQGELFFPNNPPHTSTSTTISISHDNHLPLFLLPLCRLSVPAARH